ncbi:MAG: trigger factor [Planctomycetes bacterium]|nr:trigger factor [Planctomycetota bacterium]
MQINVETIDSCRKRVRLSIPADRVRGAIQDGFQQASLNLKIPGFRPGHIPRSFIEKRYGDAIRAEVKEHLVNEGYQQALKDHNITPLSSPQLDFATVPLDEKTGMSVDFEFDAKPEVHVKNYKALEVTVEKPVTTDDEVAKQIEEIRKMRRRPEQDNSIALDENAFAVAKIAFRMGDTSVLERDNVRVMLGMGLAGADVNEFQEKLKGKKHGESFEMELTYPADFEVADVQNKKGAAKLTIGDLFKLIPPTDEEILKELDIADFDTFKKDVRGRMDEARLVQARRAAEEKLMEHVAGDNPIEIPERVIDGQVEQRLAQHFAQLSQTGQLPENAEDLRKQERARLRPEMDKGLRRLFLIDALARQEKIFVTEDDFENEFRSIAERNQSTRDEVIQYYQQNNLIGALRIDLLESKVRGFLFENAKRTEKEIAAPAPG